ncbi:MAG: AbrB/MazE/SpoVT family DNA-binding domain-containing protein [Nanoarchaeota archaeon]|nr:AbrB/MazE/SpoVT family DNA-binding domain-containing protein [Nanoarchaeota archaeon]
MEIALTKMSTKGQIVIPAEMRDDIPEGSKLILIKANNQLILKKTADLNKNLENDIIFARRTEEALKKYEKGEFKEMEFEEFLKDIKKW